MLAGPRQDRFESLDVLRGVAVLGIFAVNILAMAQPPAFFSDPSLNTEFFDARGQQIWGVMATFFQFKFITIFSALFGAGIMLMVGEDKPSPRFGVHYRRMVWLAIIGAIHGFIIWYGDILLPYAISGMIVVLARRWRPRTLFIVGGILLAIFPIMLIVFHIIMSGMTPEQLNEMVGDAMVPTPEMIEEQIAAYRGAFPARLSETIGESIQFEFAQGLILQPRHLGVMMCGMAFYKLGFFTLRWSLRTYLISGLISLAIGLYGSNYSTNYTIAAEFAPGKLMLPQAVLMAGSLFHSFGYAALIMALCKIPAIGLLRRPFAAAGQMALTNYLMCSLVGVFIYWGPPGLGKIHTVTFEQMAQMVATMWIIILIWSPIWLAVFRFGPFEWLWRSLTYWKPQPFLR